MPKGYVKCTYAELYHPETRKFLYSLQIGDTGLQDFCTVNPEEGDAKYVPVTLNEACVNYLLSRIYKPGEKRYVIVTGKWETVKQLKEQYKELATVLAKDRKVLVRRVALKVEDMPDAPEPGEDPKEKKKVNPLIWLLGAALFAAL